MKEIFLNMFKSTKSLFLSLPLVLAIAWMTAGFDSALSIVVSSTIAIVLAVVSALFSILALGLFAAFLPRYNGKNWFYVASNLLLLGTFGLALIINWIVCLEIVSSRHPDAIDVLLAGSISTVYFVLATAFITSYIVLQKVRYRRPARGASSKEVERHESEELERSAE